MPDHGRERHARRSLTCQRTRITRYDRYHVVDLVPGSTTPEAGARKWAPKKVVIEDWDGDGAIRIPDEIIQELGVDVGETPYVVMKYVGSVQHLVLSKTPQIPDRTDELVDHWDCVGDE